jgi:predicted transcriptional regulator
MNLQKAIEIAGSKSKLATLLGVSRAAVTQWDELPEKRINQLKEINEWQTHFSGEQANNPSVSNSSASETSQQ